MFKKKNKELTEEEKEVIRTKSFFDMILPSTIKFSTDHYVCGDSYRCVWAIKEYPPTTEELALFSTLADRNNLTIHLYSRMVDAIEQRKIIQNATRKNKLSTGSNDVQENITAEGNLEDVVNLIAELRKNKEPLLHCAVFLELKADSMQKLRELQSEIQMELTRSKMSVDRLTLRQKEGFLTVLPVGYNIFREQFERVLPASSVANLYPFNYSGKTDPKGLFIGRDKYGTNILVDCFEQAKDDNELLNMLNSAFGTNISAEDFSHLMSVISNTVIDIDLSNTDKNNLDLVKWAQMAYDNKWGYVWGSHGNVLTANELKRLEKTFGSHVTDKEEYIKSHWLGRRTSDCVGLIKGYGWYDETSGIIKYGTNGMKDVTADGMFNAAVEKGPISTMPDIPGIAVWHQGHIGVYIGNGYVIHAANTYDGVIKTPITSSGWTHWLKVPYINYVEETDADSN